MVHLKHYLLSMLQKQFKSSTEKRHGILRISKFEKKRYLATIFMHTIAGSYALKDPKNSKCFV